MKKLLYYFVLITWPLVPVTSCQDDTPIKRELLPSRIVREGIPRLDLIYDTDGKLIRTNHYTDGVSWGYTIYEYGADGIKESRRYSALNTNSLSSRTVFTLDDFGRIHEYETFYFQPGWEGESSVCRFDYDPAGRLTRRQLYYVGEPLALRFDYTYGDGDFYIEATNVYHPGQPSEYQIRNEYTPGKEPMPKHWEDLLLLLHATGVHEDVMTMFFTAGRETFFNSEGDIAYDVGMTATERQFNSDGYLVRQVLTYKSNLDIASEGTAIEMVYEYTE